MRREVARAIALAGAAIAALGCDHFGPTGVRIGVEYEPGGYTFHFTSCRGAPIGVNGIRIVNVDVQGSGAGHDAQYCQVELRASQPIRGSWRYGSVPSSGVFETQCRALKPGKYLADVSGGEAGGYRDFRIE